MSPTTNENERMNRPLDVVDPQIEGKVEDQKHQDAEEHHPAEHRHIPEQLLQEERQQALVLGTRAISPDVHDPSGQRDWADKRIVVEAPPLRRGWLDRCRRAADA